MPEGYSYEPETLEKITFELRAAAAQLDSAVQDPVRAPDAGVSSDIVGQGLADLIRMATAVTHVLHETETQVHEASGAYADIENTATNEILVRERYGIGPGDGLPLDGPEGVGTTGIGAEDPPVYAEAPKTYDLPPGAPGA